MEVTRMEKELAQQAQRTDNARSFIGAVRRYNRAKKLTTRMLPELVSYIEVFHREKVDGIYRRKLRVHYHCIGTITIPAFQKENDISVAIPIVTRPDVSIVYMSDKKEMALQG